MLVERYLKEVEGLDILKTETGFAAYKKVDDKMAVNALWSDSQDGFAAILAMLMEAAKLAETIKHIVVTVGAGVNTKEETTHQLLSSGFKFAGWEPTKLTLVKSVD